MRTRILFTSQKNAIFRNIQKRGMNPANFEWIDEASRYSSNRNASIINYVGTECFARIDYNSARWLFKWEVEYLPVGQSRITMKYEFSRFQSVLKSIDDWLSYIKMYVDPPDLWEELKKYAPGETFANVEHLSDAPFSDHEAENISASLDKLQTEIRANFNLNEKQLSFVHTQIEYLKGAAKRQGRKDWIHSSIGVMVTIATGLALSPEKAKLLWDLVRSCFAQILPLPAP